jgi:protein-tyrosine phosphatase
MIHNVDDNLAWGDLFSVTEAAEAFDAILNVGWPEKSDALPGIEYKLKYFDDTDPFPCDDIWECVQWIQDRVEAGQRVYVHCHQGNSRSASTVIAYLHHRGMGFDAACELIARIKPTCTHEGRITDAPLPLRSWFVRDWPPFAKSKGIG